eukprot:9321425-Alexandrium_andersonii.AAC.1
MRSHRPGPLMLVALFWSVHGAATPFSRLRFMITFDNSRTPSAPGRRASPSFRTSPLLLTL